jgi:hypothetical protein
MTRTKQHYNPLRAIQNTPFAGALRHLRQPRIKTPDVRSLSLQMAFDRVYRFFVTDGSAPSIQSNGLCNYYGEDTRCAIGLLIPSILYSPHMEGVPVSELLNIYPKLRDYFRRIPRRFLSALQGAHDETAKASLSNGISFRHRIANVLFDIARDYGLLLPGSTRPVAIIR